MTTISVRIDASQAKQGAQEFRRSGEEIKQAAAEIDCAFQSAMASEAGLGDRIRRLAGRELPGLIKRLDSLRALREELERIRGSAEAAERDLQRISEFAVRSPFDTENMGSAFVQLVIEGVEPTEERLRGLGNLAAALRKDISDLTRAAAEAARGDFEGLRKFRIVAQEEGEKIRLTFGDLTVDVEREVENIVDVVAQLGNLRFAGAMETELNTLGNALRNLRKSLDIIAAKLGLGGAVEGLARGINALAREIDTLKVIAVTAAAVLGRLLIARTIAAAIGALSISAKSAIAGLALMAQVAPLAAARMAVFGTAAAAARGALALLGGPVGAIAFTASSLLLLSDNAKLSAAGLGGLIGAMLGLPFGPVAGGFAAVTGAIIGFIKASGQADAAAGQLADSVRAQIQQIRASRGELRQLNEEIRKTSEATLQALDMRIADLRAERVDMILGLVKATGFQFTVEEIVTELRKSSTAPLAQLESQISELIRLRNTLAAELARGVGTGEDQQASLDQFITGLRLENELLGGNAGEREIRRALIEASARAAEDEARGLRDTALLREEEADAIRKEIEEGRRLQSMEATGEVNLDLEFRALQLEQLTSARLRGAEAARALAIDIEAENEARRRGVDLATEEGIAFQENFRRVKELERGLEDLDEARRIFDETRTTAERLAIQLERLNELAAEFPEVLDPETVRRYRDELERAASGTANVQQAVRDLGNVFTSAFEDAVVEGKTLSDILRGLEKDIIRIILRLTVTQPLQGFLTGIFGSGGFDLGGLLGGSSGAGGAGGGKTLIPGTGIFDFHEGGLVGSANVAERVVPAALIAGAPRFQFGLAPDEFPAVLHRGEAVIPLRGGKVPVEIKERRESQRPVIINVHVTTPDAGSFRNNENQIAAQLARAADRAKARLL